MLGGLLSLFGGKQHILNEHTEKVSHEPSAALLTSADSLKLASDLNKIVLNLYGEFLKEDGHAVNYGGIRNSPQYSDYKHRVLQLQSLDVTALTGGEKKVFFLNLYNMLLIHGFVEIGFPTSMTARLSFFSHTCYRIGTEVFSLNDIEHGILRGNRKNPGSLSSQQFSTSDKRLQFALKPEEVDARIHFALVCGAKSCPPIRICMREKKMSKFRKNTIANVETALTLAAKSFCEQNVELDTAERKITLSQIFKWYASDFGANTESQLSFIRSFLSDEKKTALDQILSTAHYHIKYKDYDWSVNEEKNNK